MVESEESPYLFCDICHEPIYTVYWTNADNGIITHTCNKCHYDEVGE